MFPGNANYRFTVDGFQPPTGALGGSEGLGSATWVAGLNPWIERTATTGSHTWIEVMTHERNLRNLMAKSVFGKQQRAISPLKSK
jgi:hypothetical protein